MNTYSGISDTGFSIIPITSKLIAVGATVLALNITIDNSIATVMVALIVAISSTWQTHMLNKVHNLVNSNFHEAKAARAIAEDALRVSNDLNTTLQRRLDTIIDTAISKPDKVMVMNSPSNEPIAIKEPV